MYCFFIHIQQKVCQIQLYVYDIYQALLNTQLEQGKQARLTRIGQIVNIKQLRLHGIKLITIQEPAPGVFCASLECLVMADSRLLAATPGFCSVLPEDGNFQIDLGLLVESNINNRLPTENDPKKTLPVTR